MNCYILRLPDENRYHYGFSENLSDIHKPGFFFAPFADSNARSHIPDLATATGLHEIDSEKFDSSIRENDIIYHAPNSGSQDSTSKEIHKISIEKAIEEVGRLELLSGEPCKIVISRAKSIKHSLESPFELFRRLDAAYPHACVFLFSTPFHGTWIGASPELLLKSEGEMISSMSLAGTRPSVHQSDARWDEKNIEEQRIVTDFILRSFRTAGLTPEISGPATLTHGPVEHLVTRLLTKLPPACTDRKESLISDLLGELSPTPALCGYPRNESMEFILNHETHNRELYGGYVGLRQKDGDSISYVNLRSGCMDTSSNIITFFAGGGITRHSDPEAEWNETEMKLRTLTGALTQAKT